MGDEIGAPAAAAAAGFQAPERYRGSGGGDDGRVKET